MEFYSKNNNIYVNQPDFNLDETLDCGQAFRWEKISDNSYTGFFLNKPLKISCISDSSNDITKLSSLSGTNDITKNSDQDKVCDNVSLNTDTFIFHNTSKEDFLNIWVDYFDFNTDYGALKKQFSQDETLNKACRFAPGIRLLKQDKWEALCSFIISQNNNIPRIKGIISRLSEKYQGFPTYNQLADETVESLSFLRAGFRAKYLIDAAQKLASGELNLDIISKSDMDTARQSLMTIKGVGPKVAECALLYGMYRTEAFPVDVWIKRVMEEYYPNGLPKCVNGVEGIAQQYLFHYVRNLK